MQRLAGTVERAVGEEVDVVVLTLVVPVVEAVVNVLDGQCLVIVGVSHIVVGAIVTIVQDGLSIVVCGQRLQRLLCVAVVVEEAQMCSGNRLAGGGVDRNKAYGIARLGLMEYAKVAHAQQRALRINAGVAGGGLNHVDTNGQSLETYGVGALFPCRLTIVLARDRLDFAGKNQFGNALIVAFVVGVQLGVTVEVQSVDLQRERVDISDGIDAYESLFVGQQHTVARVDAERGSLQLFEGVAQHVHALPVAPTADSIVDEVDAMLGSDVAGLTHRIVSGDGDLTAFAQILIDIHQRVEALHAFRLAQGTVGLLAFGLLHPQCSQTGGRSVALFRIVVVKCLIVLSLNADDVEQVAVEDLAVNAFHDGGFIFLVFMFGQQVGIGHGPAEPQLFLSLVVLVVTALIGFAECGGIDSAERRVGQTGVVRLQPLPHHVKRVGGDAALRLHFHPFGFQ